MVARGDEGAQLIIGTIDRILRTRRAVTLVELAEELGVAQRAVHLYLVHMRRDLRLPVAFSAPHQYRYAPTPSDGSWAGAPPSPLAATRVSTSTVVQERVRHALYARRKLLIQGPDAMSSAFVIHPYFLSRLERELYLFGSRPCQRALMNIPLAHVRTAEVLDDTFGDDLAEGRKLRHGQGWLPGGGRHAVCLRFATWAAWASDLRVCLRQQIGVSGRHITIRFLADDLEEVHRFALALGDAVTVIEPAALLSPRLRPFRGSPHGAYSPLPQERDGIPF